MKINPIGLQAIQSYKNQTRVAKSEQSTKTFADQIEISSKAKEMQSTTTSNYATERAERLKQLKEDIDSGNYKVDAKQVAADMLKYYRR
jgi:negative regulator of flagellin synthesis FlgM